MILKFSPVCHKFVGVSWSVWCDLMPNCNFLLYRSRISFNFLRWFTYLENQFELEITSYEPRFAFEYLNNNNYYTIYTKISFNEMFEKHFSKWNSNPFWGKLDFFSSFFQTQSSNVAQRVDITLISFNHNAFRKYRLPYRT